MNAHGMGLTVSIRNGSNVQHVTYEHYLDLRGTEKVIRVTFSRRFADVAAMLDVNTDDVVQTLVSNLAIPAAAQVSRMPAERLRLKKDSARGQTLDIEPIPPDTF